MSASLLALCEMQHDAFSRTDATDHGHHDQDLMTWVRTKQVVHPTRGGYYRNPELAPEWSGLDRFEQDKRHEVLRIRAVLHALADVRVLATGDSALLLHDLPLLRTPSRHALVEATSLGTPVITRRKQIRMHAPTPGIVASPNLPAVSIEDAVAQVACTTGLTAAVIAADSAAHADRLDLNRLAAALARLAGRRGSTGLTRLLPMVDARSESPGETRTRIICRDYGIAVTPQVEIMDDNGVFARVDLLVDGTKVVIEFDGLSKYTSPDVLRREKLREQRLHRAGYAIIRVTWGDFADISALVARIRAATA